MAEMTDCLGRFVWHDMMTTDLDASLAFYQALFPEWTINELVMGDFTYPIIHVNGFDMGGFVALGDAPGVPSHCISYVAVEDCDATVAKFEAAGAHVWFPRSMLPASAAWRSSAMHRGHSSNRFSLPSRLNFRRRPSMASSAGTN
jgi:hypothetical protein